VVLAQGLGVVRWIVEAPLGGGDLLGEGFGVGEASPEAFVVGHGGQSLLHDHVVLVRREVVVRSAGWLGWPLVVPVDIFVVNTSGGVCATVVPVRVAGCATIRVPVWVL